MYRFADKCAAPAAVLLILAGVVVAIAEEHPGGPARALGTAGLALIVAVTAARARRRLRAAAPADLPTRLRRVRVRTRPRPGVTAITVALTFGLPLAIAATLIAAYPAAWLFVAAALLVGSFTLALQRERDARHEELTYEPPAPRRPLAEELLARVCMRADLPVPQLVVTHAEIANAWTEGGRVHLTTDLLDLLGDRELEAVIAHEVAHLANRDAATMEACATPSRVLLACAASLARGLWFWIRHPKVWFAPGAGWAISLNVVVAALCAPPAFVLGGIARFSVLGMSRTRELDADVVAAALTGRPSALASALLKLERQGECTPRSDLRVEPYAVLCIVGTPRRRLGRLFATHPPVALRVRRLEALETLRR
jgi:heat shock protein HtpX